MSKKINSILRAELYWYAKERPDLDFSLALQRASDDENKFADPNDETKPTTVDKKP